MTINWRKWLNLSSRYQSIKHSFIVYLLSILKFLMFKVQNILSHMQVERIILIFFFEFFNGDLNERELFVGRLKIQMFQEKNGDPLLRMIDFIINNYGGQPKYGTKKHGKRVLLSWKYQMVGHNASVFDNCNVLNSLPSSFK